MKFHEKLALVEQSVGIGDRVAAGCAKIFFFFFFNKKKQVNFILITFF
jgi:hypothetical protein